MSNTSAKVQEAVSLHLKQLQDFEYHQSMTMLNETHARLRACSYHLKVSAERQYGKVYNEIKDQIHHLYRHNGTLHKVLVRTLEEKSQSVRQELDTYYTGCVDAVNTHFDNYLYIYKQFLKEVVDGHWLNFPRALFLDQENIRENGLRLEADRIEFLGWMEIQKVENVLDVKAKLVER